MSETWFKKECVISLLHPSEAWIQCSVFTQCLTDVPLDCQPRRVTGLSEVQLINNDLWANLATLGAHPAHYLAFSYVQLLGDQKHKMYVHVINCRDNCCRNLSDFQIPPASEKQARMEVLFPSLQKQAWKSVQRCALGKDLTNVWHIWWNFVNLSSDILMGRQLFMTI